MKTIIYKIYNVVKRTLNRFNPFVITRLLKAHSKDLKALKSANEALRDSIMTLSQANNEDINILIKKCDYIGLSNKGIKSDFSNLREKVNDLDEALQLSIAMAKNEHDNLKDSFNKYVSRTDKEDYSYEYELEQKNDVLIETLRQQGISDNVINNIIDTMLLKLKLDDNKESK
tara:strand:+ start:1188 stop:1706 length:519 start_codon:yes stop_codon:yes gene_type:complete